MCYNYILKLDLKNTYEKSNRKSDCIHEVKINLNKIPKKIFLLIYSKHF